MDLKKFIADLAAGYRKLTGYEAGRKAGHDAGRAEGYEAGQRAGHDAGRAEGYEAGGKAGHYAGRAEGYEAGRKAGHDEAMTPPEPPPSPESRAEKKPPVGE
jgi:monovalent cation:H+ antiporter-2, CPA2 family